MRNVAWGICCLFLAAIHADAQAVRTFVATSGLDSNPCSRTAPCRNFAAALTATAAGGEVVVLDSGGYGAVTINKSVTLVAPPSVHAAIAPTSGCAVTVNASSADRVVVRGVYLNSQGGTCGVSITAAGYTNLETIVVNGFSTGILLEPPASASWLVVADSVVRNVLGNGIHLNGGILAKATIIRSRIENSNHGLIAAGPIRVSAMDTVASGNTIGFRPENGSAIVLERCSAVANHWGLYNNSGTGTLYVSNSTISGNEVGVSAGGVIFSRGNNTVRANTSDGAFTGVIVGN